MSSQTDHSDGPSTLPTPELNPLLNPILGQHMGRWAEVYFTTPPEKREQAVLELLRELQAENPTAAEDAQSAAESGSTAAATGAFRRIPQILSTPVRCEACGRENPPTHHFCGMCGKPLGEFRDRLAANVPITDVMLEDAADDQHLLAQPPHEPVSEASAGSHSTLEPVPTEPTPGDGQASHREETSVYEPALTTTELSFDRAQRIEEIFGSSESRPYRMYLGAALIVIVVAVSYVAWRRAQPTSQSARAQQQQTAPQATQPSASATAQAPPTVATAQPNGQPPAASNDAATASAAAATPPKNEQKNKASETSAASPPAIPTAAKTADNAKLDSSAGNGAEELLMAQRYMDGTDGMPRDRAEAAKWLWKSMAKHNNAATLMLADLYLKGDGVPKNCDQARVLLDDAALKGIKDAGERLRNIQAFGCQ